MKVTRWNSLAKIGTLSLTGGDLMNDISIPDEVEILCHGCEDVSSLDAPLYADEQGNKWCIECFNY